MGTDDLIGQKLDHFVLDKQVGSGGFAWVFEAHNHESGEPAAVKVLKGRYSGDPKFEERFRNEVKVAAELKHPGIVRILEVGKTEELTFFAMEHFPESLQTMIERLGPLPEDMLVSVAREVSAALKKAHAAGFIHRDIKPDNIMVRQDGTAALTDFGIARAINGYVTATGAKMTIGTPQYISPEQAQGRELDGRADIYSLGVTMYRAATGELPFRSSDWFELARMHVEETPKAPTETRPDLTKRVERIIMKCLAKHPDDRYDSADTLYRELDAIYDRERSTATFGVLEESEELPEKSRLPLIGAVLAVVVILVVLAIIALG